MAILDAGWRPSVSIARADPLGDPVLAMSEWYRRGLRAALITLIRVEGSSPRPLGAQMAVCENGDSAGLISGGCLEAALIAEAQQAMAEGRNRLLRYGKGSPFVDIALPCGSALDVHIDQCLDEEILQSMEARLSARRAFCLVTDLRPGRSEVRHVIQDATDTVQTGLRGDVFERVYTPPIQLAIFGSGPTPALLLRLAQDAGMRTRLYTPAPDRTVPDARAANAVTRLDSPRHLPALQADRWTAAALLFHEHEWELPILSRLLRTEAFYIGAIGSRPVHEHRTEALLDAGFTQRDIARITAPAGLVPHARLPQELAVGILAEIMAASRSETAEL